MRRSRVRFPLLASSRKTLRIEGFRLFLRFEKCVKKGLFLRFGYYLSTTCEKVKVTYCSWNTNCMERILQSKIKIPFDSHMRQ